MEYSQVGLSTEGYLKFLPMSWSTSGTIDVFRQFRNPMQHTDDGGADNLPEVTALYIPSFEAVVIEYVHFEVQYVCLCFIPFSF